ncbi:hypothetical protein [Methylibium rhizosphaerae]|uniref:hypothetical protein n=1 Tax=Methylibium rhizosphaerae TaxID=2570323 RepID=UPI001126E27F|nr:hypothetical protein [Methylibium rhizosphaerae]
MDAGVFRATAYRLRAATDVSLFVDEVPWQAQPQGLKPNSAAMASPRIGRSTRLRPILCNPLGAQLGWLARSFHRVHHA